MVAIIFFSMPTGYEESVSAQACLPFDHITPRDVISDKRTFAICASRHATGQA
jgi:hypothetical protein